MSFWSRRSRIDKVILISLLFCSLFMVGFWLMLKRTNREYYLPANHEGWITVRHSMQGAPALPYRDGFYQIVIPDSGVLYTATPWEYGWGKDLYYRKNAAGKYEQLPKSVDKNGEMHLFIHRHEYRPYAHSNDFGRMPLGGTQTNDGAFIKKYADTDVTYKRGSKSVETFFYVKDAASIMFTPPANTHDVTIEISEEYQIGE